MSAGLADGFAFDEGSDAGYMGRSHAGPSLVW